MSSSTPVPGGPKSALRRKANQTRQAAAQADKPASTRSAGAGGSTQTLLKLYTDESNGLSIDPVVAMVMALGFILSVVALHIVAKVAGKVSS